MPSKYALVITCVVAIFLSACKQNYIVVESTTAKGEVPQLGNLTFRFNKALHPDSLLNNWDSTEYIAFEPAIPGRFRWDGPEELVFSPSQPLAPASTYHVKFKDALFNYSEFDKVQGDELIFSTAPLQLTDAGVTWIAAAGESRNAALPQVTLRFNYPVKSEDLKEKLKVEVDGVNADYMVTNTGIASEVGVRLNALKAEDRSYDAKIILNAGLKPQGGTNSTQETISQSLTVPSPYVLSVSAIEAEHTGTEGVVRLYTSQQLSTDNNNNVISFEPAVAYTTEYTDFGAILRSDKFNAEKSYSLSITKGLRGRLGGQLKEDYNGAVGFGELESAVKFTNSKAVYLSKRGGGNIEVQVSNTPRLKVIISKIYESNLLQAASNGYEPRDNDEPQYASNEEDGEYSSYGDAVAGDVVYAKEIDTRSLPKSGSGRLLNLSQFEDRLPDAKGIYHVMIRSAQDYWVRDSRFISFSDIGLIAKQGSGKIVVFSASIKTAAALNGVTVNVYGKNNQLLGTGASNGDGVAEITVASKAFAGYAPALIIAKTADDFTYLPFSNTRVNLSRFDVGGKRLNATGLDAFVYAERDIYRPGEKLNYALVVREKGWKPAADLPVKIKFLLPNGKELKTFRKGLNEQGATEGSMDISGAAITGSYTMEVYSSTDVLLATKNFMIEEFVPDRIKVTTKLDKPFLRPAETTTLQIGAINFFGPPAANRAFETEIQVRQKGFSAKGYNDYDFALANQQSFSDKEVKQGTTDAAGAASISYNVPAMYANVGLLQAGFYTTVFDETGRPVSRVTTADIFTQDAFHGIKDDGSYYYPLNSTVKFSLVSLSKDGAPVNASAIVKVIKREYRTVLAKSGNYFRYDSQQEDKVLSERQMNIGNKTDYSFIPRSPGDYELRVYHPGANAYVSKRFYSYGSWGGEASSFEVNTEGNVDIELDKEKYASGDVAKILFKTPFSGRLLVTVERDGVLSYRYLTVEKKTASMDLKLAGDHVPNVYVTATLTKPHEVSDMPLTVAHGFQNITVEESGRKMPVKITAAKSVRSKTHQKVTVAATPGSYISLAAVDNGVLQVSDFKTPDPYEYYYQKAALGVTAFDMYPLLFPELRGRLSSTGGDLSLEKRVNPIPAKRFRMMSYWSGLKKVDASGNATFEFDVPQFSGEVRLMAVAFKDEKFGNAEATTRVADPIVVSSSLPRFISPGDTVLVPVTISNTTNKPANGMASLNLSGPIKVVGSSSQSIAINANSEGRSLFQIVAAPTVATAKITVSITALGEKFSEETEIAVRPPSTLQKLSGSGTIPGGSTQAINIPRSDFMAGSFKYNLVVSRSPVAQVADQLHYLVTYPYGCTEQTVSSAFPQLYYGDFVDALKLNADNKHNAAYNVMEAIRKIKMRQLYNGAVTLWDGEGKEDWWTTAYAAHFLLEAKKAGYDVDNGLTETLLSYLAHRLKTKETIEYYYNRDQKKKIAPKEVAYSLYVLSLANRPQASTMNYYKAAHSLLAMDSKYLLSAAYAASGDKRSFTSLLPAAFSGEESVQQTGGSYYSALRDEAIALNALIDVDPGNGQVPQMIQHVSTRLKTDRYLNTQERAFSFLALGKVARAAARSTATADIKVAGKTVATVSDKDWQGSNQLLNGSNIEIVTQGSGRIYYSWIAEGISVSGIYKQEDNYLKVRRQFYDRSGSPLTTTTFKQNDLIIVGITLEKAYNADIQNIVITDLLPAGFEIENPRTKEIPGMDWIKDGAEPTALDVRDDRIHFFVDSYLPKQKYYYAVRAVSLGRFKQGPVSADALYNGEMHSYHGAGTVRVVQ
ncbi:MAG TPA: MG2 domain-containing protein [Chitinophagaceae bacterium]|nr:MG2 domain-containing protein [Chitinophagaceae bacterium]